MGNFGQCDFGAITPELVLRSLLSGITAGVSCGLRFVEVNVGGKTMTNLAGVPHLRIYSPYSSVP